MPQTGGWSSIATSKVAIEFTEPDRANATEYLALGNAAVLALEQFFSTRYTQSPKVRVFPERDSLTAYWRQAFHAPAFVPECWMVAAADAQLAVMLSPRRWLTQACSNTPDSAGVRRVVQHELVHVLHLQITPALDRAGLQWFMEGLAFLAAEQYTPQMRTQAGAQVRAGLHLARLEDAWTSANPYVLCGSIADFIGRNYGHATLARLMGAKQKSELLGMLGTTETALLAEWRGDLLAAH